MELREIILDFLMKMRCENEFDSNIYNNIKKELQIRIDDWNKKGFVPNEDVVIIMNLVEQLAGGSRFFDEKTAIQVEDASIEIMEMIEKLK